jgi:hypothetical protein
MTRWIIAAAALAAAVAPLLPARETPPAAAVAWPARFEGRALTPLAPAPEDARLARDFPGRIARFSDGKRQVVLRSVASATRQLHPARDCFRAIGYSIAPAPMRVLPDGATASCFEARRGARAVRVCERITDAAGQSFADASSWYWPALLGSSTGPWLASTVVEPIG